MGTCRRRQQIRAFYGHSTAEKIEKQPAVPPPLLYHGTYAKAVAAIRQEGLKSMKRQYVHLSTDEQTARKVALRHSPDPYILCINAQQAYQQGVSFYIGNDDIWLADFIPASFIAF